MPMKAAGIFLLCAGLPIVLAALVLLPATAARAAFVLAGIAVQLVGLVLAFRAHYALGTER
jgi:hypothetical protein